MKRSTRLILGIVAAVVVLLAIVITLIPMFLNADSFRTRVETTLTKSLNRQVTIGKLNLSVWSGGLIAENAVIADDAQFSAQPFLQASSVKIRVELLPLLLHHDVRVKGFLLQAPKLQLIRNAAGKWNYASIGADKGTATVPDAQTQQTFPNLSVGEVQIEDGAVTLVTAPAQAQAGTAGSTSHLYDKVALDVKDFSFTKSFPFTISAHLPSDGDLSLKGTAGPLNRQDTSLTPFSVHLEVKHLDALAAGFVDASAGVTGTVDDAVIDASWSGQQMHVSKILVQSPHLTVVTGQPAQPKKPSEPTSNSMLDNIAIDDAQLKDGTLTVAAAGQHGSPAVYQQVNAQLSNLTAKSSSPFTASAVLPGGGNLSVKGNAGPYSGDTASIPFNAQVSLKHIDLATSGLVEPSTGIAGLADLNAQIQSNGQVLNANGTANVGGIRLARNGQPSAKPLQAQFAVSQDQRAKTGTIQHATVSVGGAAINLSGTFQTSGPSTAVDIKAVGNAVPVDAIEAFLPAVGVRLPQGSQLRGGSVTTTLTISGSTANPIISGPVQLSNTQLAGFNLGAKLQTLNTITGGKIGGSTGSGTNIRSLSMTIREEQGNLRTDKVALDVAGLGTATGAGSVSAGGALDYNMLLKLTGLMGSGSSASAAPASGTAGLVGSFAGLLGGGGAGGGLASVGGLTSTLLRNGIPVAIGGTTSNPTFAPNLRGLATSAGASAAQGLISGKGAQAPKAQAPADAVKKALGGFLGH